MNKERVACVLSSTLCDFMDCSLPGSSVREIFQARNTGVGCHFLLQGIFPTQGFNPHPLHGQADSLPLSHVGSLQRKCLICTHTYTHTHREFSRAPWWPRRLGKGGVGGRLEREGLMYTCGWFMLLYSRNQHNIVKHPPVKHKFEKKKWIY